MIKDRNAHRVEARGLSAALLESICREYGYMLRGGRQKRRIYSEDGDVLVECALVPRRSTVLTRDPAHGELIETLHKMGW